MTTTRQRRSGPDLRVVSATAAVILAIWPGQVPHPAWLTALVGGLLAAQAWAVAAGLQWLLRVLRRTGPVALTTRVVVLRWLLLGAAAGAAFAAAWFADLRLAGRVGTTQPGLVAQVAGAAGAALLAVLLVTAPRTVRAAGRAVRARRFRIGGSALALVLLAVAVTPTARAATSGTVAAPTTTVGVSADPGTWAGAGPEGRIFISRAAVLPRSPLRVYAPLGVAGTVQARARRAVDALESAGGLDRTVVLVALPTGSGWVNRAAPLELERLLGGDVATVAVQYSDIPSWWAFLQGGDGAQESARSIVAEVGARVRERPVGRRPAVVVWGESLGALAGLTTTADDRTAAGLLWAGVPAAAPQPSAAQACRTVVLTHPDDPVASWDPGLLLRPGSRPETWLPMVSFWRATADLVSAVDVPPGHGHRYGEEYVAAWQQVLDQAGIRRVTGPAATVGPDRDVTADGGSSGCDAARLV